MNKLIRCLSGYTDFPLIFPFPALFKCEVPDIDDRGGLQVVKSSG
jgi:hypothetical protein